jgi:hypothetical protein
MLCDGYTALGQPPVAGVLGLKARLLHLVPVEGSEIKRIPVQDVQHQFGRIRGSKMGRDG